jgi:hypothetical protein
MNFEDISIAKPKKYEGYYLSKVSNCEIHFPKMEILSANDKIIELEFLNSHSEIYDFLSKLDNYIMNCISEKSEKWFDKHIPLNGVKSMFNKFIKAPKTSTSGCSISIGLKMQRGKLKSILVDNRDNEIDISDFKENMKMENVSQLKYIYFSKDTCFTVWEIISAKLYKQIEKVQAFGFIDDPSDITTEESDDEIDTHSFF